MIETFESYSESWRTQREANLVKSGMQVTKPAMFEFCIDTMRRDKNAKLPRGVERRFPVDKKSDLRKLGKIVVRSIKDALSASLSKANG